VTAIRLRDLVVHYGSLRVLDGVDLVVESGEWVGVIGPNGAGKTTLLRSIAGSVSSDGVRLVDGHDVDRLGRGGLARALAMVPQRPLVPPGMRVVDYVLLGRTAHLPYLGVETHRDLDVVALVLADLDLTEFAQRRLDSLSGGELQRAVLARALAQEAPLLLLDEPIASLDVGHQQQVLELIERLRRARGLTVVSALHDLTLAAQYCDRLVLLSGGGRVVGEGPARAVLTEPAIKTHYGARVRVLDDGSGRLVVIPLRDSAHGEPGTTMPAQT
jgi:iron complex transport system ATP-binding protein